LLIFHFCSWLSALKVGIGEYFAKNWSSHIRYFCFSELQSGFPVTRASKDKEVNFTKNVWNKFLRLLWSLEFATRAQTCQMVYLRSKNPNWGKFFEDLVGNGKCSYTYLWPFLILNRHFVHFTFGHFVCILLVIWYF
jgi:hypothetical protein